MASTISIDKVELDRLVTLLGYYNVEHPDYQVFYFRDDTTDIYWYGPDGGLYHELYFAELNITTLRALELTGKSHDCDFTRNGIHVDSSGNFYTVEATDLTGQDDIPLVIHRLVTAPDTGYIAYEDGVVCRWFGPTERFKTSEELVEFYRSL
jgi:hypothetical protein